jgi:hypothetical protein
MIKCTCGGETVIRSVMSVPDDPRMCVRWNLCKGCGLRFQTIETSLTESGLEKAYRLVKRKARAA